MMKVNLTPHLCWTIAILLAIVCFLVLGLADGNKVNSFISFAASLASLILAVVAIFYSIVSTNSQSGLLHNVDRAAQDYAHSLHEIRQASNSLTLLSNDISEKFLQIPEEIRGVKSTFVERFDEFAQRAIVTTPVGSISTDDNINVSVAACLHIICKSYEIGKPIDSRSFFDTDRYFAGILFGFGHSIRVFGSCAIKLDIAGSVISVRSLGDLNKDSWINIDFTNAGPKTKEVLAHFYEIYDLPVPSEIQSPEKNTSNDDVE